MIILSCASYTTHYSHFHLNINLTMNHIKTIVSIVPKAKAKTSLLTHYIYVCMYIICIYVYYMYIILLYYIIIILYYITLHYIILYYIVLYYIYMHKRSCLTIWQTIPHKVLSKSNVPYQLRRCLRLSLSESTRTGPWNTIKVLLTKLYIVFGIEAWHFFNSIESFFRYHHNQIFSNDKHPITTLINDLLLAQAIVWLHQHYWT